jgi:hypothetical protein
MRVSLFYDVLVMPLAITDILTWNLIKKKIYEILFRIRIQHKILV